MFKYFPILFMAFIWIDALEHKFEIWASYCRLLSKITPNTLILSEDSVSFDRDRYRGPTRSVKRDTLKFIRVSLHIVIIKPWNCAMGVFFRVKLLMYQYSCFHSQDDCRRHSYKSCCQYQYKIVHLQKYWIIKALKQNLVAHLGL